MGVVGEGFFCFGFFAFVFWTVGAGNPSFISQFLRAQGCPGIGSQQGTSLSCSRPGLCDFSHLVRAQLEWEAV